jgi:DNA-binding CsgD family transcriptional regulator
MNKIKHNILLIYKLFCISVFFLVSVNKASAFPCLTINEKSNCPVGNHYELYVDSANSLTVQQVMDKYQNGFFIGSQKQIIEPFKAYWLRVEIINHCPNELTWMLYTNTQVSHIKLYAFINDSGGTRFLSSDSAISVLYCSENKIALPVQYNTPNVYYIKLVNKVNTTINLGEMHLSPSSDFGHFFISYGFWEGQVFGGLLVMILFGLGSYLITYKRLYLLYFLYTLFVGLFLMVMTLGEYFFFKNNPWINYKGCSLLLIGFIFYSPFIREMTINNSNRNIDRWIFRPFVIFNVVNSTVVTFLAFINEPLFNTLYNISLLLYSAFALFIVFALWNTNKISGRIVLIGTLAMVMGGCSTLLLWLFDVVHENHFFSLGVYLELILFTYAIILLRNQREKENSRKSVILAESKSKIESSHRQLTQKALLLAQQEELFDVLKNKMLEINGKKKETNIAVLNMLSEIDLYLQQNSWEEFDKYFCEVYPDFNDKIKLLIPGLTQYELRVCTLLRLNLSTKQIANITHKTAKSIEIVRSRIRQKMGLVREENLFDKLTLI